MEVGSNQMYLSPFLPHSTKTVKAVYEALARVHDPKNNRRDVLRVLQQPRTHLCKATGSWNKSLMDVMI